MRILLLIIVSTFSLACELPKSESLKIVCSYKCKNSYKKALRNSAEKLGYKIDISTYQGEPVEQADGYLFPGGADINPKYYTPGLDKELQQKIKRLDYLVEYSKEGAYRDPIEYNLMKKYFGQSNTKHIPLLGICRGMQMLSVSQGIPLYIDIKAELGIKNRRALKDRVYVESNSTFAKVIKYKNFLAQKWHHQGLRVPYFNKYRSKWSHLKVSSYSNNKRIAESLEFLERPVLGVQFHPEMDKGLERERIFNWFLTESCKKKSLKLI